jgi:multidrug efflux system membrane fusion protein
VRLILQQRPNAIVIPSAAVQSGSQGNFVYVLKQGDPPKSADSAGGTGSGRPKRESSGNAAGPSTGTASVADSGVEKKAAKADRYYVEVRRVVLDVTEGSQVIVASGLAAGDQVVVDGQEKLKSGSRVSPQQNTPKSGRNGPRATESGATAAQPAAGPLAGDDPTKHHKQGHHP